MIIPIFLGREPYNFCNEEMRTFLHLWLPPSIIYIIFEYILPIDSVEQHWTQAPHIWYLIIKNTFNFICTMSWPYKGKLYSLKNEKVKQGIGF